jgi:hypothetical protein
LTNGGGSSLATGGRSSVTNGRGVGVTSRTVGAGATAAGAGSSTSSTSTGRIGLGPIGTSIRTRMNPINATSAPSAAPGASHGIRRQGSSRGRTLDTAVLLPLDREQEMLDARVARLEHSLDHDAVRRRIVRIDDDAGIPVL